MAIKLVDELKAMGNFPIAHAEGINLVKTDGTEDNLQNLFDNKELGGGGDSSVTLTQQEYEALSEEQKLNGLYYTYDTKRIYKNGVQYGASDAEGIGYNNAESGIQATTVQGAIDKVVEKVDGLISDTTSSTTSTWSSQKTSSKIAEKIDKTNILTALDDASTDEQVASALLTKTELDKKASKTYLGRYVFETSNNSRLLYIGKIYSIGIQQGFTNIEVRGGRADGNFGHGYIHININGYVVANLEHPISNMTFFVTKEGNEAKLYCNMDTYCTLVVDVANGSKCKIIGEFVDSSLGTIYWNNDWQELATMDKVAHDVDTSYMSNGVLNISSIRQSLGIGCYEIMGQGSSGHGSIRLNIWQVESGSIAFSCCITDFNGVRSICSNEDNSPTVDVGNSYFNATNKIIKVF